MTEDVNVSVIYYSASGTTHDMAVRLAQAAEKAGAEVRRRHVAELAPQEVIDQVGPWAQHRQRIAEEPEARADDVVWADVILFGSPTRFGNIASQLKQFIDMLGPQWAQGKLANKVYAGFTSTQTAHGGQESTLLALYNVIYHFGGIIVPPGYTDPVKFADGNPYGVGKVTGPDNDAELEDPDLHALDHMAERCVEVARLIEAGRRAG